MSSPQINIIVPLYNEEIVFDQLITRLRNIIDTNDKSIEVILVDDGSKDNTPNLMQALAFSDGRFQSIVLSRNFGHQLALSAGLNYANATEAVLIIDGDLQDPPELLDEFYSYLHKGYDVVYAVRKKRKENIFKRFAYSLFYKILKKISYIDIPLDSGDFSLVSMGVVNYLRKMPEESRFLRGMRSWIGFNQIGVEYQREERVYGESKYTFTKLFKLAMNGIFNFSEFPIKAITNTGFFAILISGIYFLYTFYIKIKFGTVPAGFTGIVFLITLFGGLNLMAIGLIGEYILRIFFQVKGRPLFVVKKFIKNKEVNNG